jgi:hypothetical protein
VLLFETWWHFRAAGPTAAPPLRMMGGRRGHRVTLAEDVEWLGPSSRGSAGGSAARPCGG